MLVALLVTFLSLAQAQGTAPADYVVGPQDVLNISVFGEADLTRPVTVDGDGTFDFPHVGRVRAGSLTARAVADELTRLLKEFYVNPQVTVEVAKFRSQNVIVMGNVHAPGQYPLTGNMSVLGVLPPGSSFGSTSLRLSMRELQRGQLPSGFALRDGDTIFVPKAETVTVIGHVKTTGPIILEGSMTVYDVIARAGGVTDKGALNRVRVQRLIDGEVQTVKGMKLSDVVKPGDTIEVPQRYF
jgi:polysaccharide biosynthesis/export protein